MKRRKSEPLGRPCLLGKMSDRSLSRKSGALSSPRQLCLFLYLTSSARHQNHSETKLVYRDFLVHVMDSSLTFPIPETIRGMGTSFRRKDFWDHLGGQLVNGCFEYYRPTRPIITNACQPKRFTYSLRASGMGN